MNSSSSEDPLIGFIISKKCRLLRKISEGGMGVVYEAIHDVLNKKVAVKLLHQHLISSKNTINRFKREARAAVSLGIILYEIVCGEVPFSGETIFNIARKFRMKSHPLPVNFVKRNFLLG
jgi:serine/threonine protein kinase